MMKTILAILAIPVEPVTIVLGAILFFLALFVCWKIFDGSLQEMPESPKIKKQRFKVISVTENQLEGVILVQLEMLGTKVIPTNRCEVKYVEKEGEMCLEITEATNFYVQKRWLHKNKIWHGTTEKTYNLYVLKGKIEKISVPYKSFFC